MRGASPFPWTFFLAQIGDGMSGDWLERVITSLTDLFPPYSFFNIYANVIGLLAVILVSLICGAVGSLVVGNRMAFLTDALAHSAFAGIALGFITAYFGELLSPGEDFITWATPIMVVFGILIGLAIVYVREKTSLASDTVIGVFFAGAMGLGAMLLQGISKVFYFNPEGFLFGNVLSVRESEVELLLLLALITAGILGVLYNELVFTSFNPMLARSRRIPIRLCNYLFIALLAVIINLCLRIVGVLLINALLVVPAATAANVSRNLRQLFWFTITLCLGVSVAGHLLAFHLYIPMRRGEPLKLGIGGTIVVLSVILFFVSMALAPLLRRGRDRLALPSLPSPKPPDA